MTEVPLEAALKVYPRQYDFVWSDARFAAFIGGIGSGKTIAGSVRAMRMMNERGGLGMVVAPTYPMLRDSTLRSFLQVAGQYQQPEYHKTEALVALTFERGRAEAIFRSADNPERLRGANLTWAWIDEGSLCPAATWDIVIGRLRAEGTAGPCWVTTTPKGRNWLYQKQDMMTVFRASTKDNPYLAPEFIRSLEQAYTGDFARQELNGEFVSFEGLVYEEFSRDVHVTDCLPEGLSGWIVGADEGYTNPTVLLLVGFDSDSRAYVVSEYYRRQVLQDAVLDEAWQLHRQYHPIFKVDPSAAGLIAAMGSRDMLAEGARTDVMDGIRQVKARLARAGDSKPRLFIHASCVNTIAEFESYAWKKVRDSYTDQPEKQNDHAMDALRYVLSSPVSVPLAEVRQPVEHSRWSNHEEGSRWR